MPTAPNIATGQPAKPQGSSFIGDFDPYETFGPGPRGSRERLPGASPFDDVGAGDNRIGAGSYQLPRAYSGWHPSARAAVPVAAGYERGLQPFLDFLQKEMGRDISGDLFSESADIIDSNAQEGRRLSENEMTRSGYRGASAQSPFAALQLQLESAARGGALGTAARQSVLAAQERKLRLGTTQQQVLASLAQAWMGPSQLQAGIASKAPVGSVGPSYLPVAINGLSSLIGAGAGP